MDSLVYNRPPERVASFEGIEVLIFEAQSYGVNEFSISEAAEVHDRAMAWLHQVHGTSEDSFRRSLVKSLPEPVSLDSHRVLITACGAGNDFPYLFDKYPESQFFIQDFAEEMLTAAIKRHSKAVNSLKQPPKFFVGDAAKLPFPDEFFDVVFHFGGVNLYEDISGGLSEMHRVAKNGATVFFGDEGMAPWLRNTELGQMLATNNPLYRREVPLSLLPIGIQNFVLEYRFNNCFYIVQYEKSEVPQLDLDVTHAGRRGGSLRTRFLGKLEGINPALRDSLYERAEKLGISRVDAIQEAVTHYLRDAE